MGDFPMKVLRHSRTANVLTLAQRAKGLLGASPNFCSRPKGGSQKAAQVEKDALTHHRRIPVLGVLSEGRVQLRA